MVEAAFVTHFSIPPIYPKLPYYVSFTAEVSHILVKHLFGGNSSA